jgi:hypothetical protein
VRSSPKSGSALPRASRRRAVQPKIHQSAPATAVSDNITPLGEVTIEDQIARLAYALWEARGGNGGSAEEDWLRAEQEILAHSRT